MAGGVWEDVDRAAAALERRAGVRDARAQRQRRLHARRLPVAGALRRPRRQQAVAAGAARSRRPRRVGLVGRDSSRDRRSSSASAPAIRCAGRDRRPARSKLPGVPLRRHAQGRGRDPARPGAHTRTVATPKGRGVNALALLSPGAGRGLGRGRATSSARGQARRRARSRVARLATRSAQIAARPRGRAGHPGRRRCLPARAPRCRRCRRWAPRPSMLAAGSMRLDPSQTRLGELRPSRACPRPGRRFPRTRSRACRARDDTSAARGAIPVDQGMYEHARASLGDGDRPRPLHRLLRRASSPASPRTTCPTVGPEMIKRGREMHVDPHRALRGDGRAPGQTDVRFVPMMCQHCARRAVRDRVPGVRDVSQPRRAQRAGLQPLRRHPLLLEQLPVQGARVQLLRLLARPRRRPSRSPSRSTGSSTPTSPCARRA